MLARIVVPFLVVCTTVLAASTAEAAVRIEAAAGPTPVDGRSVAVRVRAFEFTRANANDREPYPGAAEPGDGRMRVADVRRAFLRAGESRLPHSDEADRVGLMADNGPVTPPAVPEVSSWVMMITGFAFVGTALRGGRSKPPRPAAA